MRRLQLCLSEFVSNARSLKFTRFLLCVLCIGGSSLTWAQSANTGTVTGNVTDQTSAVVPGVTVTLTDTATGTPRTAVTNAAGNYIFVNVAPGTYEMTFVKQGFSTTKSAGQRVKVGLSTTVDIKLQVGGGHEIVEVTSVGNELQTMNATVGNTVTAAALDALPAMNRDVATFVELQPGVSPDGSVAGAVVDQSTFMLDGGNNTNDMDGSMSVYTSSFAGDPTGGVSNQSNAVAAGPTGVIPTPADSVEEFKVNTANQTADFNSSSGAQVQVVTRRGTNTYHGSVYEYYLDNNFSANSWENNFTGTPVPNWHRSRFGFRFGGTLLPKMLGGKTYFFVNYEGYRWPNSNTIERITPSATMRLGLLTFDAGATYFNLNPGPVTYNGVTYPGTGTTLDPRGIGINPLVQQMWTQHMPLPNEGAGCGLSLCDIDKTTLQGNVGGFRGNMSLPTTSNFGVLRLDHDFGDKWHFMSSYRYFKLSIATNDQIDIGGGLPGDKLGVPASLTQAPQVPWYYVAGMTTNISNNTTNDFHYSFLRNWWAWSRPGDPPQIAGLAGALEPFGESHYQVLAPYNVNTQQSRTRFWDGKDHMFRDDVSMLRGNHLFQFGGTYQHNFNWHQRTDNGGGINYEAVYQLGTASHGAGTGVNMTGFVPAGVDDTTWGRDYAAILGLVSISQIAYTRTGPNLTLNPQPRTPAFDQSTIPYYNVYFSDTWHMKKTFTLTYGLGWTLEMPPVEAQGKQIELVDEANQLINIQSYLHSREQAALQGQVYNPIVGFTLVGNSENGRKYPYNPFYGSFSPRIAVAWNPSGGNTVVRGGYGRIYGRLNGVDLVLVPLLGTGLIQPVQCIGPVTGDPNCAGPGSTPNTAFRVGVDGLTAPLPVAAHTLPQPLFPGVNGIAAGAGEALDPNFRPNVVDSFDLTIQRQLHRGITVEMGYIGRRITHEYTPINMNAVPYMMTVGGQRFDKAYANLMTQYCGGVANLAGRKCTPNAANVQPQPFFETALAGTGYCNGYANCTQAVLANEGVDGTGNLVTTNGKINGATVYSPAANVWSLYSDLDCSTGANVGNPCYGSTNGVPDVLGGFNFARSMMNSPINCPTGNEIGCSGNLTSGVAVNASIGYANYNAGFVSFKMSDWHGLSSQSNFTWSKTLSTGSVTQSTSEDTPADPYNLKRGYGLAGYDRKFVYNLFFVYQPPFYKGQNGIIGHVLGGWVFAPVFSAGSGLPMTLGTINGGAQAFGEGDSSNFFANGNSENAIPVGPIPSVSAHRNVKGSNGIGTSGFGLNLWTDPSAVYENIRQPILGLDNRDGGWGLLRGLPYWNVDFSFKKNVKITERVNVELQMVTANLFNHAQFFDPAGDYIDTSSKSSFGTLPGMTLSSTNFISPRTMEFGLRVSF